MDDALIWDMRAVFLDTEKRPVDLEVLSDVVLKLAKIFSVEVQVHIEEPTKTRPYRLLRTVRKRSLRGEFDENHSVSLQDGGYRDYRSLNAPDNSVYEKHYDSTGSLAIDIITNWKLRGDIQAKMKLMKASNQRLA